MSQKGAKGGQGPREEQAEPSESRMGTLRNTGRARWVFGPFPGEEEFIAVGDREAHESELQPEVAVDLNFLERIENSKEFGLAFRALVESGELVVYR